MPSAAAGLTQPGLVPRSLAQPGLTCLTGPRGVGATGAGATVEAT